MAKLSTIVSAAEFASQGKALRSEIYTEPHGYAVVIRLLDGRHWYMHSDDAVDLDWTPPDAETARRLRRMYEDNRR